MNSRARIWTPALRFLSAIGRIKHGTISGYQVGCPCAACREANKVKQREKRGGVYDDWQRPREATNG